MKSTIDYSIKAGKRLYVEAMERFERLEAIADGTVNPESEEEINDVENIQKTTTDYTIKAGERLYVKALERFQRLEAIADSIPVPKQGLKNRKSGQKTKSQGSPRYLKLYEKGVRRRRSQSPYVKKIQQTKSQSPLRPSDVSTKPLGENHSCLRLYNLSKEQQLEGRKRRITIQQALIKAHETPKSTKKISLKDAERLYYEGIKHLLELDSRRIEAAEIYQTQHQPYRFRTEVKEKALESVFM